MIHAPAGGVHAAAGHSIDDVALRNIDLEHVVEIHTGVLHRLGLWDRPRKPVEQVTDGGVGRTQPVFHQADDDVVGYQRTRVHHFLGGDAERRAGRDRRAQHVPG